MSPPVDHAIPDPNGPPTVSERVDRVAGALASAALNGLLVLAVGGGTAVLVLSTIATPTAGALRSTHVTWERRRADLAAARNHYAAADTAPQSDDSTEPLHD
jgi:hypothetical protein